MGGATLNVRGFRRERAKDPQKMESDPNWAHYRVCPVCGLIMSAKPGKLVKLNDNLFIHAACAKILERTVKEKDDVKG